MGEGYKFQRQSPSMDVILYNLGDENTAVTGGWVEGFSELPSGLTSSQTKQSDHLYIALARTTAGTGRRSWITANPIDLTELNKLVFDWQGLHTDGYGDPGNVQYAIQVVTAAQRTSNELTYTANYSKTFAFARETAAELNVSALNGSYYIRFIVRAVNERANQGKLFSIKGVV